jgi:hypothetical protein
MIQVSIYRIDHCKSLGAARWMDVKIAKVRYLCGADRSWRTGVSIFDEL